MPSKCKMEGRGRLETTPVVSKHETGGHRTTQTRVSTRWKDGEGRKYPPSRRNTTWRAQKSPDSCFDTREGQVGWKTPSVTSKRETGGIGVPRFVFRHEGGAGGVENTLRRVETRDGGHRSPPTCVSTWWRGGEGRKYLRRVETRDGGHRSPLTRVSTRGRGRWGVKHPPSRRNTRRGHRSPPTHVSTRWRGGEGRKYPLSCRNTRWRAQNPPNSSFDTREGRGSKVRLSCRNTRWRGRAGHRGPPSRVWM